MNSQLYPPSISMSLLDRLRERKAEDWSRLLALFVPVVYQWGRLAGLQDCDAADVVQEVFAAVHVGLDNFRKDSTRGSFRGWLHGITRNKVCDHFRRRERGPLAEGGSDAVRRLHDFPDRVGDRAEENAAETTQFLARRALELIRGDFEVATWAAFHAVVVEERPAPTVAEDLGVSVGTVYVAKSRVLKRLREELAGLI
jgi:RNA polymerase sigma-70 factor (ECF subfamily)